MLKESFLQTIKGRIWNFLLGSLGAVIAILLLGKNFFDMSVLESVIWGISFLVILLVCRYLYFLTTNIVIYVHNVYVDSIWGKAIVNLKDAYSEIHYIRKKEQFTDTEFIETMLVFCDTLKQIFDRKTRHWNRSCFKKSFKTTY